MNGWNWQLVVTVVIVAGAVFILARRAAFLLRAPERSSCGGAGCGSCPSTVSGAEKSIVQLEVASMRTETNTTETA
jgi:hypothetical protein